jgi:hypothetical protein
MRTWSVDYRGVERYVVVTSEEVAVGQGVGLTDTAGGCTHEEFVQGRFHDVIREAFGDAALGEMVAEATNEMRSPSPQRMEIGKRQAFLARIPMERGLVDKLRLADTENGSNQAFQSSVGWLELRSDMRTLTLQSERGLTAMLTLAPDSPPLTIKLPWQCTATDGAIVFCDHFYLAGGSYAVVLPSGDVDSRGAHLFGDALRINGVYRSGETILFRYAWFNYHDGPRGVLRYVASSGFVGRDEWPNE